MVLHCCLKLTLYLSLNPVRESRHPCVDSRLALLPAAVSPGRDPVELEATRDSVLVDQGAPRISLKMTESPPVVKENIFILR